jgi:LPXTG-site transpeptidase (sortase) family protein
MKHKKLLTKQSKWTLVLIGGLLAIYLIFHWDDVFKKTNDVVLLNPTATDFLYIDELGIAAPIVYSQQTQEKKIQEELANGIVHLSGTARVGQVGNMYIVGHSSNSKNAPGNFNSVFAKLPNIPVGGKIVITHDLKHYTYVVYETRIVEPTELWVESQATSGEKILTLQTSYPVGTANKRFVAIARLAE